MAGKLKPFLSIGEVAARTGLSVSAIRFYQEKDLVRPDRNAGGQRRFSRADLRRLSFVVAAQRLGLSLTDIKDALDTLPNGRAPTKADWTRLATRIRARLEAQVNMLQRLQAKLDGCLGCGCLSLETCALYNPGDRAASAGPGPRFVLDAPAQAD
jgi:MerR family redox-sensitive transcriptional activator SoxR